MNSIDSSQTAPVPEAATPSSEALLRLAVGAAEDRKASDIKVLELAKVSDFTDWFVICSGSNDRQVKAIAELILERFREHGSRPLHVEGLRNSAWVLLDFGGEMVIHVFREDTRSFYGLERLWDDAPEYTDRYRTPTSDEVPASQDEAAQDEAGQGEATAREEGASPTGDAEPVSSLSEQDA